MRPWIVSILFASFAVSSAVAGTEPSAPKEFVVTRWSAAWTDFSDDFEDGVFPDGDPGEVTLYESACGVIVDADESAGRLRLQGPQAPCGGAAVAPRVLVTTGSRIRARFQTTAAPPNIQLGLRLDNGGSSDRLDLLVDRGTLFGPGSDAVGVTLYAEDVPIERLLLSEQAASYLAANASLELELEVTPSFDGTTGIPHARFRTCPLLGCSTAVAFTELPDAPGALPGAGSIASGQRLFLSLGARGSQAFVIDLLDWQLETSFADEFDGILGDRVPYKTSCVEASIVDGSLRATLSDEEDCDALTARVVAPGEASVQATFAGSLPGPCSEAFGVALLGDRSSLPSPDGAALIIGRGPIPGIGNDVLYAALESESDEPQRPWFELLPLSTTPDQPGSLYDSIEVRIETTRDAVTGKLVPHGQVRPCFGGDCDSFSDPFRDLVPFAFPQDDPNAFICDLRASDFAPPLDGGTIDPIAPLIAGMIFVPEPAPASGGLVALSAIGAARIRRHSLRREDFRQMDRVRA